MIVRTSLSQTTFHFDFFFHSFLCTFFNNITFFFNGQELTYVFQNFIFLFLFL